MITFKRLLTELNACSEAREWAGDRSVEEVVEKCHRGDWLLWLAAKVGVESRPLTLAKEHCANTILHLMKDEQSIKIGRDNLYAAADAAYAAATAYAAAADAAAAVKKENQLQIQTADICRKYIGQLIIDKVNQRLNEI